MTTPLQRLFQEINELKRLLAVERNHSKQLQAEVERLREPLNQPLSKVLYPKPKQPKPKKKKHKARSSAEQNEQRLKKYQTFAATQPYVPKRPQPRPFDPELHKASQRLLALRAMPYKEYLQTPEWQMKRKEKLGTSEGTCEDCGGYGNLNIHHLSYKNIGCERMDDLAVLCRTCHKQRHGH